MAADGDHTGTAGEMVVKAELAMRAWNVGSPSVDRGADVMAWPHEGGEVSRIQVKTGYASEHEYGYSAKFAVGTSQLQSEVEPPLHYVFAVRYEEQWGPFVVIAQPDLQELVEERELGYGSEYSRYFYFRYHRGDEGIAKILCEESDLIEYKDDFSRWERVEH